MIFELWFKNILSSFHCNKYANFILWTFMVLHLLAKCHCKYVALNNIWNHERFTIWTTDGRSHYAHILYNTAQIKVCMEWKHHDLQTLLSTTRHFVRSSFYQLICLLAYKQMKSGYCVFAVWHDIMGDHPIGLGRSMCLQRQSRGVTNSWITISRMFFNSFDESNWLVTTKMLAKCMIRAVISL